jgi:hypothetical protein
LEPEPTYMKKLGWSDIFGRTVPKSPSRHVSLHLELLDQRVCPTATTTTTWTNATEDGLWSTAGNWSDQLPNADKIAILDGNNGDCTFDNSVQAANRTVAGLKTINAYSGTLRLTGGFAFTISALNATDSGLKWSSGSISQGAAQDVLVITGAGGAEHNIWSGGTIGSTTTLGEFDINDYSTLKITGNAAALGASITGPAATKALHWQELRRGTSRSIRTRGVSWRCCPCRDVVSAMTA